MTNTVQGMTLHQYFEKWFNSAVKRMTKEGVVIDITLNQFLMEVVTPRQYASLQKTMEEGWLNSRQHTDNLLAYVISWKSYAARSSNVFNVETACFCTRQESAMRGMAGKGEELRASHRHNISKATTGKPKTECHAANISESMTGRTLDESHKQNLRKPKAPWSPERKAARAAQIAAKKAGLV